MGSSKEKKQTCGAKTRSGGRCQRAPLEGSKRCALHGGKSTGPKSEVGKAKVAKNAVVTGLYETIVWDTLDEREQALYGTIQTDSLRLVEEELKILLLRERRMMQRIANLRGTADALMDVEVSEKTADTIEITQKRQLVVLVVQRIEEALTQLVAKKTKLIDMKFKLEQGGIEEDGTLDELMGVLAESRRMRQQKQAEQDGDGDGQAQG